MAEEDIECMRKPTKLLEPEYHILIISEIFQLVLNSMLYFKDSLLHIYDFGPFLYQ